MRHVQGPLVLAAGSHLGVLQTLHACMIARIVAALLGVRNCSRCHSLLAYILLSCANHLLHCRTVFGEDIEGDILSNMSVDAIEPLVGTWPAIIMVSWKRA